MVREGINWNGRSNQPANMIPPTNLVRGTSLSFLCWIVSPEFHHKGAHWLRPSRAFFCLEDCVCWAKLSRSRLLMFSCQANCHLFFPLWCVFIYVKCNPKRVDYLMASEGSSYLFLRFSSKGFNLWPFTLNASPVFGFLTSIAPHEDIVWTMYGFIHLVRSFPRNMRRRELYKSTFCPERFFAKLLCHAWPWRFPCKAWYSQMLHFLTLQVRSTTVSSQYQPIGYTYSISWQPNRPCAQLP